MDIVSQMKLRQLTHRGPVVREHASPNLVPTPIKYHFRALYAIVVPYISASIRSRYRRCMTNHLPSSHRLLEHVHGAQYYW